MERVALNFRIPGKKEIGSRRTVLTVGTDRPRVYPQNDIGGAIVVYTLPGIPPAKDAVSAGRPLADEQRITQAIANISKLDPRIQIENTIVKKLIRAFNAKIVRKSNIHPSDRAQYASPVIGWTREDWHHRSESEMRRRLSEIRRSLIGRDGSPP